jgi:hypothetical protein
MQVEETTQSTPLRPTRAGFVRGLPLTMPVEEVIERGREVGIELQPSDIHAARYYMRQQQAAEGSSIPQQLLLGGTFVTKPVPQRNGNALHADAKTNGFKAKSDALESTGVVEKLAAGDEAAEQEQAPAPRRRKIVQSKAVQQLIAGTQDSGKDKENSTNGAALHDRLQARLANATFRETQREDKLRAREDKLRAREDQRNAREEQRTAREDKLRAREDKLRAREEQRVAREEEQRSARQNRQNERQTERQIARAKQERQARQERLEKATIGKALEPDSVKSRSKRTTQSIEKLEEQARLIALRLGTQRVRELLDEMEELARQA